MAAQAAARKVAACQRARDSFDWLLNSPGARDTDEREQWQLTQFF